MATATIPRVKISPPVPDFRVDLATDAQKLLGYNLLARAIATPNTLIGVLAKCGIEPLDTRSVERYKRSKEHVGMWSGTRNNLLALTITLSLTIATLIGVVHAINLPGTYVPAWLIVLNILGVTACIPSWIALSVIHSDARWGEGKRTVISWATHPLSSYNDVVPEFALDKAIAIKRECPSAEFYVDQLQEGDQWNPKPRPDPFLLVKLGSETLYLDVWDEYKYERTL